MPIRVSVRVSVIGPSRHPVVEPFAGGQEAHTAALVAGLRRRGHRIRLYAAAGTDPGLADELVTHPDLPRLSAVAALDANLPEPDFLTAHHTYTAVVAHIIATGDVDVVHNQSLHHLPLSLSVALPAPLLTTLHTPPFPWMELGAALATPDARFVAVSHALAALWTELDPRPDVILNGVDPGVFRAGPGGPDLVWVGRLTPEKGADLALDAATRAGRSIRLVGPVSDPGWYDEVIRPRLGAAATHIGHLDQAATAGVVGASSVALVTPRWDEPFGLVAAEAAMCGTPVVAVGRGGLVEVVDPSTGVLVRPGPDDEVVDEIAAALAEAAALDRATVRAHAVKHLSVDRMVDAYEERLTALAAS